jgi:hydroxymethylpyrimidine pyrophosphatase-like HAD family hydrolase
MPDVPYFSQINTQLPTFEESAKVTASVNEAFGEDLNPLQNGECLDIVRKDINKAVGLYKLAEILSAKKEDIIAVGDNINDTHMIAEFRSYAMENAVDSIKELADFVTPSVTDLIEKELAE